MIWGIVLIPISLLMAIGVVPSHRCALPAAPRHNATPDVAGTYPARPNVAKLAWGALRSGPESSASVMEF